MKRNPSNDYRVFEVSPRDGLQNETPISCDQKIVLIKKLIKAGIKNIEVTSFVNPKKVEQMKDADELFTKLNDFEFSDDITFSALIPNIIGLNRAIQVGVREIAILAGVSDEFNEKNVGVDVASNLGELRKVAQIAQNNSIQVRGYIAAAFGHLQEGDVPYSKLKEVVQKLLDYGAYEISLADTTAVAKADFVRETFDKLTSDFDIKLFAVHLHNTKSQNYENLEAAFKAGIKSYDSSIAGLGGCPFVDHPVSNLSTEVLVSFLNSKGIETGIDLSKIKQAAKFISNVLNPKTD